MVMVEFVLSRLTAILFDPMAKWWTWLSPRVLIESRPKDATMLSLFMSIAGGATGLNAPGAAGANLGRQPLLVVPCGGSLR